MTPHEYQHPTALYLMINNLALWQAHVLETHAKWSGLWKHDIRKAAKLLHESGFYQNARALSMAIGE